MAADHFHTQPDARVAGIVDLLQDALVSGSMSLVSPGVGKTHLAISLAIAAAEHGRRVYYGTLASLIESLAEAKAAGNLSRRLRVLTHPALLVVDSCGARGYVKSAVLGKCLVEATAA